jgi:predicted transcriptional regulator
VSEGGLRCSQERRERLVNSLLADGLVERVELEKPQGRANHYLRLNEELIAQHYSNDPGSLRV